MNISILLMAICCLIWSLDNYINKKDTLMGTANMLGALALFLNINC